MAKDGSRTWLRPDRKERNGRHEPIPVGPHLYDGIPGIAIFLIAVSKEENRPEFARAAEEALRPWRRLLLGLAADSERAARINFNVGGFTGLGAFVYSLTCLGRISGDPTFFEEAFQVCGLFNSQRIQDDQVLDLIAGSTGAILGLLAFARAYPERRPESLDIAQACAEQLVNNRIEIESGGSGWITNVKYPPQNGFGHGAAGVACALTLLAHALGADSEAGRRYLAVARSALQFEHGTYSSTDKNWRDQTGLSGSGFLNQWCYGPPGIAMARAAIKDLVADPYIDRDIAAAVATTNGSTMSPYDHLCCGEFGRVESLLFASQRLADDELYEMACSRALRALERYQERGQFFGMIQAETYDPSLLSGTSGIGYTLLRLVNSAGFPSILAMDI